MTLRDKAREVNAFYQDEARHWTRRGTWEPPQHDDLVLTLSNRVPCQRRRR